jgi:hypothetical protein
VLVAAGSGPKIKTQISRADPLAALFTQASTGIVAPVKSKRRFQRPPNAQPPTRPRIHPPNARCPTHVRRPAARCVGVATPKFSDERPAPAKQRPAAHPAPSNDVVFTPRSSQSRMALAGTADLIIGAFAAGSD